MGKQVKKFKPKRGQIDYTHIRWAPVINCVLTHKDKILLVHRSKSMSLYPGYWSGISGFLDDKKGLEEKVAEEIREELGLPKSQIKRIKVGRIFDEEDPRHRKTWIVHPVLVEMNSKRVSLNWEAEDYRWLTLKEVKKFKLIPNFNKVLKSVSPWLPRRKK